MQIRTILVTFEAAARIHAQRGDDHAVRWAFDRAQQLLDSLPSSSSGDRHAVLEARDRLLQAYRHHVESDCDSGVLSHPNEGD